MSSSNLTSEFETLVKHHRRNGEVMTQIAVSLAVKEMGATDYVYQFQRKMIDGEKVQAVKFSCTLGGNPLFGLFEPETWIIHLGTEERNLEEYS